jgi:hypothetical protein
MPVQKLKSCRSGFVARIFVDQEATPLECIFLSVIFQSDFAAFVSASGDKSIDLQQAPTAWNMA